MVNMTAIAVIDAQETKEKKQDLKNKSDGCEIGFNYFIKK
jgi:hypothetical protein